MPNRTSLSYVNSRGLTMVELLIVIVVIAFLILAAAVNIPKMIVRGYDGRRKADLEAYRIAFEHYYEDEACYPDPSLLENCGSGDMRPYLPKVMCDPTSKRPYAYERTDCKTFTLYASLNDEADPSITTSGCTAGCGPDDDGDGTGDYNYGLASGGTSAGVVGNSGVPPTCGNTTKFCFSNFCGFCCPGTTYRCNSAGNLCIPDNSC